MKAISCLETDIIQGDIRFRESDHTYIHIPTGKKFTSVSSVIRVIYATKSFDGVDPAIIENARQRGIKVDKYLSEYVRNGRVVIDRGENRDVTDRVRRARAVWEEEFGGLPAESQRIVFDLDHHVAGMMDFWIDNRIVADLKATAQIERYWILQLGAYFTMAPRPPERGGILHVNKDEATWMEYSVPGCKAAWARAIEWWTYTNGMVQEAKISR